MASQWTDNISAKLGAVKAELRPAARRGLFIGAEHVLGVALPQTPWEEGDFGRSGTASVADEDLKSAVSYKDTAFPGQAEWLHEDLEIKHDEGRNAKFLEHAMNSESDTVAQIVATQIREDLGT